MLRNVEIINPVPSSDEVGFGSRFTLTYTDEGEEITEEVFEAHAQEIFDEAENRLHAQKAVMYLLMNLCGNCFPYINLRFSFNGGCAKLF
jgi:hypothetical protein